MSDRMSEILDAVQRDESMLLRRRNERVRRAYLTSGAREAHSDWQRKNRNYVNTYQRVSTGEKNTLTEKLSTRSGMPWTESEDELLMLNDGRTLYQKAIQLGRTLYSAKARHASLSRQAKLARLTTVYPIPL